MSATQERIPVAPLVAVIKDMGGLGALPTLGRKVELVRDDGYVLTRYDRTPAQRREWERLRKMLRLQARLGWIDLYVADAICVKVLQMHPLEVYGWAWIDGFDMDEEAVA